MIFKISKNEPFTPTGEYIMELSSNPYMNTITAAVSQLELPFSKTVCSYYSENGVIFKDFEMAFIYYYFCYDRSKLLKTLKFIAENTSCKPLKLQITEFLNSERGKEDLDMYDTLRYPPCSTHTYGAPARFEKLLVKFDNPFKKGDIVFNIEFERIHTELTRMQLPIETVESSRNEVDHRYETAKKESEIPWHKKIKTNNEFPITYNCVCVETNGAYPFVKESHPFLQLEKYTGITVPVLVVNDFIESCGNNHLHDLNFRHRPLDESKLSRYVIKENDVIDFSCETQIKVISISKTGCKIFVKNKWPKLETMLELEAFKPHALYGYSRFILDAMSGIVVELEIDRA